ncbi:MAG: diacylglycerol kinase family protein [Clostridiales bacterium]|nr:diacylglycerol kinase family protein [Clostridiales bacterium]
MNYCILYNPFANNGQGKETAEYLPVILPYEKIQLEDITLVKDYKEFFTGIPLDTIIIVCGGDGTLNRFINATKKIRIKHSVFYYPCGSGNDFARDIGQSDSLIPINDYIPYLPVAIVNGQQYSVLNGVGFGVDGYCCEVSDKMRQKKLKKPINYTSIAIKGLLFHYKPTNAVVTVDGKEYYYKKVWIAPTMNGRYYGGGMMPSPKQNRNNTQNKISVMVFHGCGKLKTLSIFPSLFKGEHVKKKKNVEILFGHTVTVKFDQARTVQIDGEVIANVTEYTVKSAFMTSQEKRQKRIG